MDYWQRPKEFWQRTFLMLESMTAKERFQVPSQLTPKEAQALINDLKGKNQQGWTLR